MGSLAVEETTLPEAGLEEAETRAGLLGSGRCERPSPVEVERESLTDQILAGLEIPVVSAEVSLVSGRRCSLEARPDGDRLTVRARDGKVVLRVTLTDAGPVLSFEAADLELRGTRTLRLDAEAMEVSTGHLRTHVGGDVETRITGTRHTRIDGAEHLEAGSVQAQANTGAVEVRAAGHIAMDGEHIGLNDDPCPTPFPWTAIAEEETDR